MDAIEIRKLREHILDMRARQESLQWDAKVALTKAESIHAECIRLESLVDKLEAPQA